MNSSPNIARIKAISSALQHLNQQVVFVGGATVALYVDAVAAPESRPTDDVDVIIELASYGSYSVLDEQLRQIGFTNDILSGVICRYQIQGITVDIMPTKPEIIGFNNRWYPEGFANATPVTVDDQEIRIFTIPYFLATKIEAFKGRGGNDYRTSSDFEDIVFVLENNGSIAQQLAETIGAIRHYLQEAFSGFLADPDFEEGLYGHLEPHHAGTASKEIITLLEGFIKS
jgi:predicted nucleotidyltransferase